MDESVAALVRRALQGDVLTSAEISGQMELALPSDQTALHLLMHWITDDDLRRRDAKYDALQRQELANLLTGIRHGS